jgi:ribonuclease HII
MADAAGGIFTNDTAVSNDTVSYKGELLVGVDEVGRGSLAGDVVAAAVMLDGAKKISGLVDSKKLSEKKRIRISEDIKANCRCYSIGRASAAEIDDLNILQATLLAMFRAVDSLAIRPEFVVVDGNQLPDWQFDAQAIVRGDSRVEEISAASILAKVVRDAEMVALDGIHTGYGFVTNKGYGTREHLVALAKLGACSVHRRSFRPVSDCLAYRKA